MKKILLTVDGLDRAGTTAALDEAVRLYAQEPVQVHLLSVQPPVSGHVAMFFDNRELHELQATAGAQELAPAEAVLRSHGIPWTSSVRVGRRAEAIAKAARELGCDRIVFGREGQTAPGLAHKVFGSVSEQVRQLVASGSNCQVIGA